MTISLRNAPSWLALMIGLLLACALAPADAGEATYQAGKDYERIQPAAPTQVPDEQVEVVVLFWYGCPHCYHFDPLVADWAEQQPDTVKIRRMPLASSQRWSMFAEVFYAAKALGVLEAIHMPLFRAIHDERRRLFSRNALVEFCAQTAGVEQAEFRDAMDSLYVQAKLSRDKRLARQYQVTSVPNMIIHGRYRVSASTAGSPKRALKVADYLVKRSQEVLQTTARAVP